MPDRVEVRTLASLVFLLCYGETTLKHEILEDTVEESKMRRWLRNSHMIIEMAVEWYQESEFFSYSRQRHLLRAAKRGPELGCPWDLGRNL